MTENFALTTNGRNSSFHGLKAMILAAGLGSRLKPWTDKQPKALAVVNGKSLLERNIQYLQRYNVREVVVNVYHFADQIIDAVEKNKGWGSEVIFSDERDEVLETGGGFLKAAPLLQDAKTIVLMNADILTDLNLQSLVGYHQDKKPLATLATTDRKTSRYFLFDRGNNLCGWRNIITGEEKSSDLSSDLQKEEKAFSGIHIIEPEIFSLIKQRGKFSMIDVYLDLMDEQTIKSFDHSETRFVDVGKPESISRAEMLFA